MFSYTVNCIYLITVIYIIPMPIVLAATGIADIIEQFKAQADAANLSYSIMQSLTADYIASSAELPMQSVDFTTSTDLQETLYLLHLYVMDLLVILIYMLIILNSIRLLAMIIMVCLLWR